MNENNLNWVSALIGMILFLGTAVRAEEKCPVEIKLLLSPLTTQRVIASLEFKNEAGGRVYFFDTDALDLLLSRDPANLHWSCGNGRQARCSNCLRR